MEWASKLDADAGGLSLIWRPDFAFDGHATDERIVDIDGDGFSIDWLGDPAHGSDEKQAIALINDGVAIASWWPQHVAGEVLRITVHYGGAVRPHLFVNGAGVLADDDWVAPTLGSTVSTPTDIGEIVRVQTIARRPQARIVACLGDSLSVEWFNNDVDRAPIGHVKAWPRFAGLYRRSPSTFFLACGVGGDQLPGMLARVEADVVDAGATDCVLLGGLNDTKANRTFPQMRDDAADIAEILRAAKVRARAKCILPFGSAPGGIWTQAREDVRVAFNEWLQAHPVMRGVPMDRRMGDGGTPPALLEDYDISDGEHPSAAGAHRLGRALVELVR